MKVKQNSIVLFNTIKKNEYGLLNPLTKKLHRINETGRFIWETCKEARSTDELASMMAEHFHIPIKTAQKDVNEFIDRMVSFGLLEEW